MKKFITLFLIFSSSLHAEADEYTLKLLIGEQLQSVVPFIVAQRISEFKEYPYLYEGNIVEENELIQWFAHLPDSAVAVAYCDGKPVGFVSGTSFVDYDVHFKGSAELFKKNGLDPKKFYYIPEVIIVPEHRRKSLWLQLHALVIEYAQSLGYESSCWWKKAMKIIHLSPQVINREMIFIWLLGTPKLQ